MQSGDSVASQNDLYEKNEQEKLSFWTKFVYGSGDLGTAISAALRGFFLVFFLTDVARINPVWVGALFFSNRAWDAINDPVVGWLSDKTYTRWGRRRPWLLFGAVPFGLAYVALWYVPPFGQTGLLLYYFLVLLILDTTYTVVNVPYTSLTPELTRDSDERTSLNSYRFAFSVGGALISAVLHPIIVGSFDSARTGYIVSGAVWATLGTITILLVFLFTRERPESMAERPTRDSMPYMQQVRTAISNRPYQFVVALYLFSWLALQLLSVVLVFYATYYMRIPADYYKIGAVALPPMSAVLLAVQGTSLIFIFIWSWVAHRLEKRTVYIIGAALWLVVLLFLSFITPDMRAYVLPLGMLAGAGVAVAYLIPWSMMADVMEVDEWNTGLRREGIFYGFMVFLQKISIAIAGFLVTWSLARTGYITPTDEVLAPIQPDSALWAIRLFIGPVPAIILVASIVVAVYYPITRAGHAELVEKLDERRAEEMETAPGGAVPSLIDAEEASTATLLNRA
jgi:GPH family glycoside/pentoside/hexuronide:cation symporter